MYKYLLAALVILPGLFVAPAADAAARSCIHAWAVPGVYTISGKFRGKVETAGASLSRDCKVNIRIPGVSSNTKVKKAGRCLRFRFKVEGVKKAFAVKWCNKFGDIPWNGKKIRARVKLVKTDR